jgi:hypothetical protein
VVGNSGNIRPLEPDTFSMGAESPCLKRSMAIQSMIRSVRPSVHDGNAPPLRAKTVQPATDEFTNRKHLRQRHWYAASPGRAVWPHLSQMYLPSTWATMGRNSRPETQLGHRTMSFIALTSGVGCMQAKLGRTSR